MVDPAVVRMKADVVDHHVRRLRARVPLSAVSLDEDEDLRNIVLMDLQQAIQAVIDLAAHTCSHEGLGTPDTPGASFALLARANVIDTGLSIHLAAASGLRNLIAHRYGDLLMEKVADAVNARLDVLEAFVRAILLRTIETYR